MADALARIARWRVPLGFVASAAVLWLAQPTRPSLAAGTAVVLIGEAVRMWAAGHLNKSREVTASGPYRWFAHPLYVGSSILGAGLALASASIPATIVIALYLGITLTAAVRSEEAALRSRFGDAYDRYRTRGDVDVTRRFSWARATANGEHRTLGGIAIAWLALLAKLWSGV